MRGRKQGRSGTRTAPAPTAGRHGGTGAGEPPLTEPRESQGRRGGRILRPTAKAENRRPSREAENRRPTHRASSTSEPEPRESQGRRGGRILRPTAKAENRRPSREAEYRRPTHRASSTSEPEPRESQGRRYKKARWGQSPERTPLYNEGPGDSRGPSSAAVRIFCVASSSLGSHRQ